MTDIKRRKVELRGLLVSLALVALVAAAVDPAAQAGPPTPDDRSAANALADRAVGARHVAVKPEHTSIKNGYSKRDIQLKFVEGSGVELRGESFVSTGVDVTAVNDLLSSVPALRVAPIFTSDPDQLRREKARLQELSGRDLADLSLYFYVTLPSSATGTPAKRLAERLIDAFNALPIVEFAQPVPKPAPPPSSNLSKHRQYEFAVLEGIGATQVTGVPGVHGDHVQIVDIEYNWNDNHEDLTAGRPRGVHPERMASLWTLERSTPWHCRSEWSVGRRQRFGRHGHRAQRASPHGQRH